MPELRQTVRSILHRPTFAVAAILTIALGIGANTAVYAVIHAVLLQPLPFRDPARLVQVWETHPELHNFQVSVPDYLDWKKSVHGLHLAAYTFQAMDKATLTGQGDPVAVQGTNASSELFPLLGIKPLIGHLYDLEAERGKGKVALISEQLWRRKFAADPAVIGRPLRLGQSSFTIVGVLDRRNAFPSWADVWLPFSSIDPDLYASRKYHPLEVIGRLNPGVSVSRAEIEIEKTARQLSAAYPVTNGKIGAFAVPLMETIVGDVRPALLATWIAVVLVLLIAITNLTHLMMARTVSRQQEISIRLALGASRWAVFRTFLLEATILSLAGGAVGILASLWVLPAIRFLAQGQIPRFEGMGFNFPVLLFGVLASFGVALLFALPSYSISFGDTRGSSIRRSRLSSVMMSSEVALSVAVLLAAIVLFRSFSLTLQAKPGFQPNNLLALHASLSDGDGQNSYSALQNLITPELEHISGIQAVAAINSLPMTLGTTEHSRYATRFGIVGRAFEPGRYPTTQLRWGTANYLQVLGVALRRGRFLIKQDHDQAHYLINQTFADRFFPHSDPLKQKLLLDVTSSQPNSAEIVGVVGDIREFGLTSEAQPTMYLVDASPEMELVFKTRGMNPALINTITATMRRVNPQQATGPVKRMDSYIADSLARQRFILVLIATFAGLAVFLGAIGIYGVFSYSVTRRLREFGIRSAIGARQEDLLVQVLRECLIVVVPGLVSGLVISAVCSRFISTLLYRVSSTDPFSSALAITSVLLLCFGCVAIPALRAAKVDPATILREQ